MAGEPSPTAGTNWKSRIDLELVKQVIKWTVYILLLGNFYMYIMEDMHRAAHSLPPNPSLGEWMVEYSTSIDFLAWIILIGLFELETYVLEDHHFTPVVDKIMAGMRICCYFFVFHTFYAYSTETWKMYTEVEPAGVSSVCDVADQDISFVSNLRYTDVTSGNCGELSNDSSLFLLEEGIVITDRENLKLERILVWMDQIEVMCWLSIMLLIELVIRLQNRGIAGGRTIEVSNRVKFALYSTIMMLGLYWAWLDHLLYLWDEFLWIGGFAAIEMNVADWREELQQEEESSA